jgi:hypothetical protein
MMKFTVYMLSDIGSASSYYVGQAQAPRQDERGGAKAKDRRPGRDFVYSLSTSVI